MRVGGEAVAEVLRCLPRTRNLASLLNVSLMGVRPFQSTLNLAYLILDDIRPLFGCESCGRPKPWVRPIQHLSSWFESVTGTVRPSPGAPHFKPLTAVHTRTSPS